MSMEMPNMGDKKEEVSSAEQGAEAGSEQNEDLERLINLQKEIDDMEAKQEEIATKLNIPLNDYDIAGGEFGDVTNKLKELRNQFWDLVRPSGSSMDDKFEVGGKVYSGDKLREMGINV